MTHVGALWLALLAILATPETAPSTNCRCTFSPNELTLGSVTTLSCRDNESGRLISLKELPPIDGLSWLNKDSSSADNRVIALRSGLFESATSRDLAGFPCLFMAPLTVIPPFDLKNPPPIAPNSGPRPIYELSYLLGVILLLLLLLLGSTTWLLRRHNKKETGQKEHSLWQKVANFTLLPDSSAQEQKAAFIQYFALFRALLAELSGRRGSQPTVYELRQLFPNSTELVNFLERGNFLAYSRHLASFAEYEEYVKKGRRFATIVRDQWSLHDGAIQNRRSAQPALQPEPQDPNSDAFPPFHQERP